LPQEHIEKKENFNRNEILLQNIKQNHNHQQLIIPTLQGFEVVKLDQIMHFEADGNFTQIHLQDGSKKMVCRFLKHFDDLLAAPFVRIHRSHIINTNFMVCYQKGNGGVVTLTNKKEIDVASSYKDTLLKMFNN
jgi:two-component system LytT family response regulator